VGAAKPFDIPKKLVWEAYLRVKAAGGAPGMDGQTIEAFERDLKNNLYRIWNRMSSGTYFPPPVLRVAIPKRNVGSDRPDGAQDGPGAGSGAVLPSGLVWIPSW
jgi:RNA-directed DNA polymerase